MENVCLQVELTFCRYASWPVNLALEVVPDEMPVLRYGIATGGGGPAL